MARGLVMADIAVEAMVEDRLGFHFIEGQSVRRRAFILG